MSRHGLPINSKQLQRRLVELSHRQAQADALFDSIGQGAIATDKDGKINRINQSALDILGRRRGEMIGKWFPEAVVAVDDEGKVIVPMDRTLTKAFLTGKALTRQMFYRHSNGTALPVTVTVSPIMLNKLPVGAVEVFRDITHELEVDTMKTEFIYLASHQLRTPLTAVKTYAHMLSDGFYGKLTADQKKPMRTIIKSLDRMNDVISTLLNISRMEAGKISFVPSPVCLPELVRQCLAELSTAIKSKNISIRTNFPSQIEIKTDPLLVKEVCLNLLSNAIKYTQEGGKVMVSISHNAKEQVIRVQDSGYGIPEDAQNRLFVKFYRAPNILDKEESGTGLGLYLVRGVTNALGGRVWFTSRENEGSTFYLALPVKPPTSKQQDGPM